MITLPIMVDASWLFSDPWCVWAWKNYSMAIVAFPSLVALILKIIAIYHPGVHTDEVTELLDHYWSKRDK